MRGRIEAAIKDAYYAARDNGGTMHTAATDATDAVMAVLTEPDEATVHWLAASIESLRGTVIDGRVANMPPRYMAVPIARNILAALAGTSAQARHTDGEGTGGGEHG